MRVNPGTEGILCTHGGWGMSLAAGPEEKGRVKQLMGRNSKGKVRKGSASTTDPSFLRKLDRKPLF